MCLQPVPDAWDHERAEAEARENLAGPVLQERLQQIEDDQNFEAEELTFAEELQQMPAFSAVADDEERTRSYVLQRIPPALKRELDAYILHRTSTFAARRQGGAVQSVSAECDKVWRRLRVHGIIGVYSPEWRVFVTDCVAAFLRLS